MLTRRGLSLDILYTNLEPIMHREEEKPEAKFLVRLFKCLNEANLHYAVMRNYDLLPLSADGSDLDLLIDPQHEQAIMDCIVGAIRDAHGVVIGHIRTTGLRKIFALGKPDNPADQWWGLRLDICIGMVYRGSSDLLDESLWNEQVEEHNGIKVLSPHIASVLGVMKEFLHNGIIADRYIESASFVARENWAEISPALSPLGNRAIHCLRELCLGKIDGESVDTHSNRVRCGIEWRSLKAGPWTYLRKKIFYFGSRLLRFLSPPGKMVVVLGTDGAGKSTVIESIKPALTDATHGALVVKHLRPGLLPPLGRIKDKQYDPASKADDPHGDPPSGYLLSLVRLAYYFLDYTLGYWLLVRRVIAKSPTVVLYDRYAHDILLDPRRLRIHLPHWILRAFVNIVPKPDLIICLYGDPEVLAGRKQELPADEIRRQVNDLVTFAENEERAVLVNTESTVTDSRNHILESIVNLCARQRINQSSHRGSE